MTASGNDWVRKGTTSPKTPADVFADATAAETVEDPGPGQAEVVEIQDPVATADG